MITYMIMIIYDYLYDYCMRYTVIYASSQKHISNFNSLKLTVYNKGMFYHMTSSFSGGFPFDNEINKPSLTNHGYLHLVYLFFIDQFCYLMAHMK